MLTLTVNKKESLFEKWKAIYMLQIIYGMWYMWYIWYIIYILYMVYMVYIVYVVCIVYRMRYVADDGKAVALLMDLSSCRQNTLVAAIERLHKIIQVEDIGTIILNILNIY